MQPSLGEPHHAGMVVATRLRPLGSSHATKGGDQETSQTTHDRGQESRHGAQTGALGEPDKVEKPSCIPRQCAGRLALPTLDGSHIAEIGVHPDDPVVTASVFKVPVLTEYVRQVSSGELDRLMHADPVRVPALAVSIAEQTNRSTPRECTTLLRLLWTDAAADADACAEARRILGLQVWSHRLGSGFPSDDAKISGKNGHSRYGAQRDRGCRAPRRSPVRGRRVPCSSPFSTNDMPTVAVNVLDVDPIMNNVSASIGSGSAVLVTPATAMYSLFPLVIPTAAPGTSSRLTASSR